MLGAVLDNKTFTSVLQEALPGFKISSSLCGYKSVGCFVSTKSEQRKLGSMARYIRKLNESFLTQSRVLPLVNIFAFLGVTVCSPGQS